MNNKNQWLIAALVAECLALSACMAVPGESQGPTLADLQPPLPAPAATPEVAATSDDVKQLFEAALAVTEADEDRHRIQQRLAGLALQQGEAAEAEGGPSGPFLNEAIGRYDRLLASHPDAPGNDYLLYQLGKAYDLAGQRSQALASFEHFSKDYPSSQYAAEVHFRRGEMLYTDRRYLQAQEAYAQVIATGSDGLFYHNAVYMLGWAQFKQGDYPAAIQSFSVILDATVPASGELAAVEPSRAGMVNDSLRALSLAFSHEQGVTTLDEVFANRAPHYLPLLYSSLAGYYLDKERFRDAAETYSYFLERYPESPYAPQFSVSVVESYTTGGFPSMTVPAMQFYVENYGIHSQYWARSGERVRSVLRPQLRTYLDQLARHEHALGQALIAASDHPKDGRADDPGLARQHLGMASRWYREFVDTVPDDPQSPEMMFLMAESLFEAADYQAAVVAYEAAAYGEKRVENDAEAGYAALLAYDRHIAETGGAAENWRQRKVASALRFAETHPDDLRSVQVLVSIANESLRRGDLEQAAAVAGVVTDLHEAGDAVVDNDLLNDAWMLRGQAQFDMANYLAAEQAFSGVLGTMDSGDPRRQGVIDLLAASVYRHSEANLRAGDSAAAVQGFLRVSEVAPESTIAVQAQYDAAGLLMERQQWGQAEVVFRQLRGQSLPPAIAEQMPARMAEVYVHQEKWLAAAQAYEHVAEQDTDVQRSRQALYRSAELYQQAGKADEAIAGYRQYTRQHPAPFATATEARFQLAELYRQVGDAEQRSYWLQQLIATHRQAGSQASDRSLFLAVAAESELADEAYLEFAGIELALPLRSSMKRKQRAMTQALSAYERVLDYQVVEFASQARFRIGEIYGNFSADLLASERPLTLDAEGLARYEMLLEEQAYPFEEKAIAVHETNARLARMDNYDDWVQRSYQALAVLMPGRYNKLEYTVSYNETMY